MFIYFIYTDMEVANGNLCMYPAFFASIFFLIYECFQMKSEGADYITDVWNIFDLVGFGSFYLLFYF